MKNNEDVLLGPVDNRRAYEEGWGLFLSDDGETIQKMDDPPAARPDACFCGRNLCMHCAQLGWKVRVGATPVFKSDDAALLHVISKAQQGSMYHVRAVLRHIAHLTAREIEKELKRGKSRK